MARVQGSNGADMTTGRPSRRYRAALAMYQALLAVSEPLIWRYFRRRGQADAAYLEHWDERRGEGDEFAADVWVHAVSLGEFRSAEPVITDLLSAGYSVVLTHATPAGRRAAEAALAAQVMAGKVAVRYAPLDRERYWRRFLALYGPRVGLVFEMEFWPGMAEAARVANVPMWYVNSQVPGASFMRARRIFAWLGGHPAGQGARVLAKSERMAERFRALGASRVDVAGETRFDIAPPSKHVDAGHALKALAAGRTVYTFASVVEGEEDVFVAAAKASGGALVIWVPRAPEVFEATYALLREAGLRVAKRSESVDDDLVFGGELTEIDVLLGDSFGEMFLYLSAADVVCVGGGFVEKGAHNVIEPLSLGKPVITGPHTWTIEFPGVEAEAEGVLHVCRTPDALAPTLAKLAKGDGVGAREFHRRYAGASTRLVKEV
ncbi:MAG: glycosyltransferase N-terminal domain-containing protein, partial [Pseudomonadota bacterium]